MKDFYQNNNFHFGPLWFLLNKKTLESSTDLLLRKISHNTETEKVSESFPKKASFIKTGNRSTFNGSTLSSS